MANVTYQLNFPDRPVDPDVRLYPVAAATSLKKGWMICLDANKNAVKAADAENYVFKGVCMEDVDNSSGSAGDKYVQVFVGEIEFTSVESEAQTSVDALRYVKSNHEVAATGSTTYSVRVGPVTRYISSTKVMIDPRLPDPVAGASSE